RHERMGRDRETALLVDLADRRPEGPEGANPLADEQRQEMTAERRDLLADDDLDPEVLLAGHGPRCERRVDALVIRDRDEVEARGLLGAVQDRGDAVGAVRCEGVDVEVGPTEGRGHGASPVEVAGVGSFESWGAGPA